MSTAVANGGTRLARVAPMAGTRMIRVSLIRAGTREMTVEVPAGTTTAEIAEKLGVSIDGMSLRSDLDAIDADTPLEVDCDVSAALDITAG